MEIGSRLRSDDGGAVSARLNATLAVATPAVPTAAGVHTHGDRENRKAAAAYRRHAGSDSDDALTVDRCS
ncbi:MAG TPA: hypothetical protein VM307_12420 [Egibacteraceae bacterium]|nr:hypothetical protein [Egibacteraceae bacterium]